MLKPEIASNIVGLSNVELWEMINSEPDSYTPEALEFAKEEWERRRVPEDEMSKIRDAQVEQDQIRASKREREGKPLSWFLRIVFVLIPLGFVTLIIPIIASAAYLRAGRTRAADQVWSCVVAGVLGYAVLIGSLYLLLRHAR